MLQPGTLLQNRYRILRQIGGGGMGVVYLADDTRLPARQCAIKEMSPAQLPPQDRNWAIQAFKQEAQMLARLSHPGLTAVTDFFPEGGNWYLVMDYVVGETLKDRLERAPGGRLPLDEALNVVRQLCNVLEYLHGQSPPVVFRDLKPGNVMLTPQGEVKLIDFGIARFFKPGQTRDTVNLGTPGYAAPEQYGGAGQSDPRTDIYSLGALLLQMVTGYDPTTAVSPFPLPAPGSLMRGLPPHVEATIVRATQMHPDRRYRNIQELRQDLFPPTMALPQGMQAPATAQQPYAPSIPGRSRAGLWIGLGVVGVLFVGGCVLATVLLAQASRPPQPTAYIAVPPGPMHTTVIHTSAPTTASPPESGTAKVAVPPPTSTPTAVPTEVIVPTPTPTTVSLLDHQVLIPAGVFVRGSTRSDIQNVLSLLCPSYADSWCRQDAFEDELILSEVPEPKADVNYIDSHQVSLHSFYIDRYEVTNAEYTLCVQAGACAPPASVGNNPRHSYFRDPLYAGYPVIYVTWYDAQSYCSWVGARLPTATEWERAARGTDGRWWPWGNNIPTSEANFRQPGESAATEDDTTLVGGDPAPVGSYPADRSPDGVMDMAGNVMEWVDAWYGPGKREIRGGSWNTGSFALRTAGRTGREPDRFYFDVGFRCARDAEP